jgi:hypothetical protein
MACSGTALPFYPTYATTVRCLDAVGVSILGSRLMTLLHGGTGPRLAHYWLWTHKYFQQICLTQEKAELLPEASNRQAMCDGTHCGETLPHGPNQYLIPFSGWSVIDQVQRVVSRGSFETCRSRTDFWYKGQVSLPIKHLDAVRKRVCNARLFSWKHRGRVSKIAGLRCKFSRQTVSEDSKRSRRQRTGSKIARNRWRGTTGCSLASAALEFQESP